ncbi:MAG: site-specific integrase, partial [Chitinophagales bacterium]|nr:site-specific integrase [Chitinophagales bacterium]
KIKTMASVAIIYRKDKLNKNNEAPIHLRIIKDRKINYVTTGIMIPEKFWDEKANRIRGKFPGSNRMNSFIANKFAELQDQVFEHETNSKSLTTRQLKENIYGKKPTDFFAFADEIVGKYSHGGSYATYAKNRSIIAKLKEFNYGKSLMFQDITLSFLTKYEAYLRDTLGNKVNTIHRDMKFIRQLFNAAYRHDLIEHNQNPFLKYQIRLEKTQRIYLTEEELQAIENFKAVKGSKMELHKNMFVFASYAGGLRVSDVLQLKWKNFDGTYIHFSIKKTNQQLSVKVPNAAIEIMKLYKTKKSLPNHFVFPILPTDLDLENNREVHYQISKANAYINKNLKVIAEKTGLDKHLSFHISRHTWATRALRKGISIDKVSKIMGHAAIRETQIYAKIVSTELDNAMDLFNL